MGERALQNRIERLKALERQQADLQKQIKDLKDQLKQDMEQKGVDELQAGSFLIRWKTALSNRFDTKAFQRDHEKLYSRYLKPSESRRFTIA